MPMIILLSPLSFTTIMSCAFFVVKKITGKTVLHWGQRKLILAEIEFLGTDFCRVITQ